MFFWIDMRNEMMKERVPPALSQPHSPRPRPLLQLRDSPLHPARHHGAQPGRPAEPEPL